MQAECCSCPFSVAYVLWGIQAWLMILETEIGLEGDGYNRSKHISEDVLVHALCIQFLDFTVNIV